MPIRLHYEPTRLRLAASLGDPGALDSLPAKERDPSDDAFNILMSCSDLVDGGPEFDYGPPRFWPYSLEAAMRMAIAVYRDWLPDWRQHFERGSTDLPPHIPAEFAPQVVSMVTRWIIEPGSFSWGDHERAYLRIVDDICLDGQLANAFPQMPALIRAYCYGSGYLIDVENCQPEAAPMSHEYNPEGLYAAGMNDAIGWFLIEGFDENRIRRAVKREVLPWCLGRYDPLI
jgi:hypothetical protein